MNSYSKSETGEAQTSKSTLEQFFNELSNPSSMWHHLKVAEMSGCDYVFVPGVVCRKLTSLKAIQVFIKKIQTLLGSARSRTTLVSFWHDTQQQLHFEKYTVVWAAGIVVDARRDLLDDNPQQEFISMLFEHSEPLICVSETAGLGRAPQGV